MLKSPIYDNGGGVRTDIEIPDLTDYNHLGSLLYVLQGAPVDRSFKNVITFANAAEQTTFFKRYIMNPDPSTPSSALINRGYTPMLWVRDGQVTIPANANYIRGANYIMFVNNSYYGTNPPGITGVTPESTEASVSKTGTVWRYAFIDQVRYNADLSTTIYYTIDLWQTYQFSFFYQQSFVKRCTPYSDAIGANLVDEGLALGPYQEDKDYFVDNKPTGWWVIVGSTVNLIDNNFGDVAGMPYFHVYSGVYYFAWSMNDYTKLQNKLLALAQAGKSSAITEMHMVPALCIASSQASGGYLVSTYTTNWSNLGPIDGLDFGGYTPRCKKLYTYPYQALKCTNHMGQSVEWRFEFMVKVDGNYRINYKGSPMADGKILAWPVYYNGMLNQLDYAVAIGDYPQCSWSQDNYANWLATQQVRWDRQGERRKMQATHNMNNAVEQMAVDTASQLLQGNVGGAAGAAVQGVRNIAETHELAQLAESMAASSMAEESEVYDMSPPSAQGTVGNGSTLIALDQWGWTICRVRITGQYARMIDEYFWAFGYKQNRVMSVTPRAHVNWDYYECDNAIVVGNAPAPATDLVRKMLNSGVRFWHNQIPGNYNQSNGRR